MNEQQQPCFDEQVDEPEPKNSSGVDATKAEAIAALAALTLLDYETSRIAAANRLGVRVGVLDTMVERARPKAEAEASSGQGTPFTLKEPTPWHEPVDGDALLLDLRAGLRRHVVLNPDQTLAVALWIMHAHALDQADHSPRLHISSPVKRCGKSVLLRTIASLATRPLATENITVASLFRVVQMSRPTLLIDEVDAFLKDNEDMRGVLNAGHDRDGKVVRVVGEDHEPRCFAVFAATVLAGIGEIPATIEDRSITIRLRRRLKHEPIERLGRSRQHLEVLARKIARWVDDNKSRFADDPLLPEELNDRAQDNWRPLIAIAQAISPDVEKEACATACVLERDDVGDADEAGVQLLEDVYQIFMRAPTNKVLSSDHIANELASFKDRPWPTWNRREGKPISMRGVARLLGPFGIKPKQFKSINTKGYALDAVVEAYARYCTEQPDDRLEDEEDPM